MSDNHDRLNQSLMLGIILFLTICKQNFNVITIFIWGLVHLLNKLWKLTE